MYPYALFLDMDLYSICFMVGILFAFFFVDFATQKKGFSVALQRVVLLCGFAAVAGGYGSAILFQAFYDFLATGVFQFTTTTGATFFGGLIGGVLIFIGLWCLLGTRLCKDKKEPFKRFPDMLDIAAACVPIAHGLGRLGCLFAGCCHGDRTDAWYGIDMFIELEDGGRGWAKVVPIQLYEAIFLFVLGGALIALFFLRAREKRIPLAPIYTVAYGVWRFVIEFFRADDRGDSPILFMTPSQLTAAVLILIGAAYFILWLLKKAGVFDGAADRRAFKKCFDKKPECRYCASGRINIIGEHIDYCGGKVLPAALGLKCYVLAAKNGLDEIRLIFKGGKKIVSLPLADLTSCKDLPIGNYQAGVAYELQKLGEQLVGCDLYYRCEVPFGGALSSSAAIEVATALALAGAAEISLPMEEIALLCQRAEREFVGVNCGIMDQFISAFGKKDNAVLLDCDTLNYQYVPVKLGKYTFLLANCNRPHDLKESKYNERREETEKALAILQADKKISCLAAAKMADVEAKKSALEGVLYSRAKHVVEESARVQAATEAMSSGDMLSLGKILDDSHESLKSLFEVSCAETDGLQEIFKAQKGCVGARMVGGGFGGCVLALVESSRADVCQQKVVEAYDKKFGYPPTFYPVMIDDGVRVKG